MSDSPLRIVPSQPIEPDLPDDSASTEAERKVDEMAELRRLLIEPEQTQINNILDRLNNPRLRARETSRVLSEAIKLRSSQDDSLTEALAPTIVTSFHNSVKKDPRPVADAISPLMGPAIRRAISAALNSMIQTFDQALKNSFSWQGLKWRIEAWGAGQSFAEVVMLHTLLYRVEQVFLIHKKSGVKLNHVAAPSIKTQDADIVSGMLTAIQEAIRSFAYDSFDQTRNEHSDTLPLGGDREVWFEQTPQAVLAVVIHGKAPQSLRSEVFAPAIEAIQYEQREALESFDGDTTPFELSRAHLESCLLSKYEGQTDPAKFKIPLYVKLLAALLLLAIIVWALFVWRDNHRWNNYLNLLDDQPGVSVSREGKRDGKWFVSGVRDPEAADPEKILREQTALDPDGVISRWEVFPSSDPQFVLRRAKSRLNPPAGVELKFEQGKLSAAGAAPHQWIVAAQSLARTIPDVAQFDDTNLIDEDLDQLRRQIEQEVIRFVIGKAQIASGQNQTIRNLTARIQKLIALAAEAGRSVRIEIVGHTDTEGDEATNQRLSDERSARILFMLTSMVAAGGSSQDIFSARGAASKEPVRPETSRSDREFNRSVSFKVALLNPRMSKQQPWQQRN